MATNLILSYIFGIIGLIILLASVILRIFKRIKFGFPESFKNLFVDHKEELFNEPEDEIDDSNLDYSFLKELELILVKFIENGHQFSDTDESLIPFNKVSKEQYIQLYFDSEETEKSTEFEKNLPEFYLLIPLPEGLFLYRNIIKDIQLEYMLVIGNRIYCYEDIHSLDLAMEKGKFEFYTKYIVFNPLLENYEVLSENKELKKKIDWIKTI